MRTDIKVSSQEIIKSAWSAIHLIFNTDLFKISKAV